MKQSWR